MSIEENEEEQKQKFYELQKVKIENSNLLVKNTKLEDELKKTVNELKLVKETYQELQEEITSRNRLPSQENISEQNLHHLEKISGLELKVEKLVDEKIKLEQKLHQYQDYDAFKKKFEKFSIDKESIEAERDMLKKTCAQQEQQIAALKDQVEMYELEIDLAARGDEIPSNPEELKKNYLLLKSAFDLVDMDLKLQADRYEERLNLLNNEISQLKSTQ